MTPMTTPPDDEIFPDAGLSDDERSVLDVLVRQPAAVDGQAEVPLRALTDAAGLPSDDAVRGVLRSLAGRVVTPGEGGGPFGPVLSEVWTGRAARGEPPVCRYTLGPVARRHLRARAPETPLRDRLAGFGLTPAQVDHALGLPADRVERNLSYVEDELGRGREIASVGAYAYRAVLDDWAALAASGRRKRAEAVRARAARTWRSLFGPPALASRSSGGDADAAASPSPDGQRVQVEVGSEAADAVPTVARLGAVVALLVVLLGGCARDEPRGAPETAAPAPAPARVSPLWGVWDLAESSQAFGDCHQASIGFRSDGRYMTRSGDQVVVGRYVAERSVVGGTPGFLVVQRPESHNGRPNCQGVPAATSVAASPPDAFVEVYDSGDDLPGSPARGRRPDRARVYFGGQSEEPAAVLVRRTTRGL